MSGSTRIAVGGKEREREREREKEDVCDEASAITLKGKTLRGLSPHRTH